jgi:hypothetical protein
MFEPGPAGDDVSTPVFVAPALVEIGVLTGVLVSKIASAEDDSIPRHRGAPVDIPDRGPDEHTRIDS